MGDMEFNGTPEEWDALVEKNKLTQSYMKKQTAFNWLHQKFATLSQEQLEQNINILFMQAKAIEKEQIIEAYKIGFNEGLQIITKYEDVEQYYTSTYE